jgi:hypothetical protein
MFFLNLCKSNGCIPYPKKGSVEYFEFLPLTVGRILICHVTFSTEIKRMHLNQDICIERM